MSDRDEIRAWLDSAPEDAKTWLRWMSMRDAVRDQANRSFQMAGAYDGAMSEECKAAFKRQYEFLCHVQEWQNTK